MIRLAVVLKHANSCPPFVDPFRQDFYALKQAVLESFGERDGEDVQHIKDACWNCSDGVWHSRYDYEEEDGERCMKCNGTGIYREVAVVLERWKLAGHIFHRPLRRMVGTLALPTIEGRIRHRPSMMASAAQRVLTLVFRPQYYLYLDQWRLGSADLIRFKACLAYLLGFERDKWRVESVKFGQIEANQFAARMHDVPMETAR